MFGYNNYGNAYIPPVQQRPMAMPMTQSPQQPVIAPCPFSDVRFANEKEADGFMVLAGQKVLLIDSANQKMWIKSADNMGTSTTETYRFERVENQPMGSSEQQKIDINNFVVRKDLENVATKDELLSIKETIKELEKRVKISQILSEKPISDLKKE